MKVLLVALVLFVVAAYAQVRPRPSEVFEAEALLIVKRGNDTFHGAGRFFSSVYPNLTPIKVGGE